jgi:ferric-dicitrate binding protein FerR (iron transport regulator)
MSDQQPKDELDDLVREMKADRGPTPDWQAIDERLFAKLEAERGKDADARYDDADDGEGAEPASRTSREGGRVVWIGSSIALAAAAAALLLVRPSAEGIHASTTLAPASAGAFVGGDGVDVALGGAQASSGQSLAQNETIDVRSGTAYFEQTGAVRWVATGGSALRVEHAASPLVLSLARGAAEAQVTPVPSGEAFAIDVTSSSGAVVRVAVHGTHLRVARDGDKITVDLNEGVVSIGAPPRRGSTIGSLVTAPAHIELDARDPLGTMHVDHDRTSVRPAEAVSPQAIAMQQLAPATQSQGVGGAGADVAPGDVVPPPSHADTVQRPSSAQSHAPAAPVTAPESSLRSPDDVGSTVKTCIADASTNRADVGYTFTTTLTLFVDGDGNVKRAHFYPPLPPQSDLQTCVARAIYKGRLSQSGDVTIPISVSH